MIYVFEDLKGDLLSELFMQSYDDCSFVYAEGAGNLMNIVSKLLTDTSEMVAVYLDVVPDNRETVRIYNNLKQLSIKNGLRVIVFPIACTEYYFIKSLPEHLFKSKECVRICLDRGYWKDSDLIETEEDTKFVKNFEKFCKLILLKNVASCVQHTRTSALYGYYYKKRCLCENSEDECSPQTILDKSLKYVQQYPFIPSLNFKGDIVDTSVETAWFIHKKLIDDFNKMVGLYKQRDCSKAFTKISYIVP